MAEEGDQKTPEEVAPAGGVFGPFWELFRVAKDVHPLVPYATVILLLIVTATLMMKLIAPYAGQFGPVRTIIYFFLLVFFLMAFFATFAEFFVGNQSSWKRRFTRIVVLLLLGGAGAFGAFQVANAKPENCELVALLAGPDIAKKCIIVPPPTTVGLTGLVMIVDDPVVSIPGAMAKIVIDNRYVSRPQVTPDTGTFTDTVSKTWIGRKAQAWVAIPNIGIKYDEKIIGPDGASFVFNISRSALPPGTKLVQTTDAAALTPKIDGAPVTGKVQLKSESFNGAGLYYTLFFCQAPDGDSVASRNLATQLQTVVNAQAGVAGSEIRAWPPSTTPGYGNFPRNAVVVNQPSNGSRDAVSSNLLKLWAPYIPAGVTARPRFVSTAYSKLTAIVCV